MSRKGGTGEISVSRRFDSRGGELELKELGVTLIVPAGALPRDTMTITISAVPGNMVAYEFEPHGTIFRKALTVSQDLGHTRHNRSKDVYSAGYFSSRTQLDVVNGRAHVDETIAAYLVKNELRFDIWHFSGYMVSTGFVDDGE